MRALLVIIFLSLTPCFLAQDQESDLIIYMDSLEQAATEEQHDFVRILKDFYADQPECIVMDFYKSGQRKLVGKLYDKYRFHKSGPFTTYYENGKMESQVTYKENEPSGQCYFWYENGSKKAQCEFVSQGKSDEPLLKVNQYWSRIAIQRVVNGKGHFQDEDVTSFSEGELADGLKDGEWWGADYKDGFTFTENYKKGKLISGVSIDSLQQKHGYKKIYIPPMPAKSIEDFYNHFDQKMRQHNRDKHNYFYSTLLVGFFVDKTGKLNNITVLHDIDGDLKRKIISFVASYGLWRPAVSRGIITEMSMMIPVYVKLK